MLRDTRMFLPEEACIIALMERELCEAHRRNYDACDIFGELENRL